MAFKDFKLHFKLEYDIKTNAYNMQKILELINHNICKELDLTEVKIIPTVTRLDENGGNEKHVSKECYEEYGNDLDSCPIQELQGCRRCPIFK